MDPSERFTLRWDDFLAKTRITLRELREKSEFCDIILVADDGKQLQAHQVILAEGSSFFHKILKENPHPRPLIYMRGVPYEHLSSLLDFVYTGEANVTKENLDKFLDIAEELKVKGLTRSVCLEKTGESRAKSLVSPPLSALSHDTAMFSPQGPVKISNVDDTEVADSESNNQQPDWYECCQENERVKMAVDHDNHIQLDNIQIDNSREIYDDKEEIVNNNYDIVKAEVVDRVDLKEKSIHDHIISYEEKNANHKEFLFEKNKCSFCKKTFRSLSYLENHERIHTGDKPFQCSDCPKSFGLKSSLKRHQRIHTGEKPYECSFCQKTFPYPRSLKEHERSHTGEKPYQCLVCHKTFNQLNSYKVHKRIHTGEKPYQCSRCSRKFHQLMQLKNHEKRKRGCSK